MSVEFKTNVLVVDDDKEIVGAIAALLEREGYNIYKAYDGLMALDMVMSNDIHLMLIDVMMPNMDGLSAIMRIREKKNIPIIVLSAKTEDTDKIKAATDELEKKFGEIATKLYQQAQPEGTPDMGADAQQGAANDGNTFDAEYTVDDNQ